MFDLPRIERSLSEYEADRESPSGAPSRTHPDLITSRAAVAAVLRRRRGDTEVLFIRRAEHPGDPWSGHMAFPGGREEPFDTSLLQTAIRETREELGLDLHQSGRLLGSLPELPVVVRAGMVVRPIFFELTDDSAALNPNHEVAETLWAPLTPLFDGSSDTIRPYERRGQTFEFPAYDVRGRVVWGLTYQMLQSLFALFR